MDLFQIEPILEVGFTGTQVGMTDKQMFVISSILGFLMPEKARHGDCIGADTHFHNLVRFYSPSTFIVVHPPIIETKRAWMQGDLILPPKKYMRRNDDIIRDSNIMLATPEQFHEIPIGSGTWATIRHTKKAKKPIITVWPDGTYTPEGNLQFSEKCVKLLEYLQNLNVRSVNEISY